MSPPATAGVHREVSAVDTRWEDKAVLTQNLHPDKTCRRVFVCKSGTNGKEPGANTAATDAEHRSRMFYAHIESTSEDLYG